MSRLASLLYVLGVRTSTAYRQLTWARVVCLRKHDFRLHRESCGCYSLRCARCAVSKHACDGLCRRTR